MSREKQIDIIRDYLVDFDEMGFIPSVAVPDPEAYAIKWREEITRALEYYFKQSEGEWIRQKGRPEAICSNCGREVVYQVVDNKWEFENFCPHCGLKMKGGAE